MSKIITKEEKLYTVYMHVNKINNKKYIGITCQKLKIRWGSNGSGYTGCTAFYNAIQKYGWDNFEHLILFEGLTQEEACNKEIELINEYNTTNKSCGYNISEGGKGIHISERWEEWKSKISESHFGGNNPTARKIIHIDKYYNLIKIYDCARDAERELGVWTSKILNVCHGKQKHTGGMFFIFYEDYINNANSFSGKTIEVKPYRRSVIQKDLIGNIIAEYKTIKEAVEKTGADNKGIINVCKGIQKTSGGYLWEYAN